MAAMNSVQLMGNLTRDPETKYTSAGKAITKFGIAVNRTYNNRDGERVDEVTFVDITAFSGQGEVAGKYLKKGSLVALNGRLSFYTWETEQGEKRSKLSVVAENIILMPKSTNPNVDIQVNDNPQPATSPDIPQPEGDLIEAEDDIPF